MLFPATVTDRGGGTFEVSVQAALSAEARPSRCLSVLAGSGNGSGGGDAGDDHEKRAVLSGPGFSGDMRTAFSSNMRTMSCTLELKDSA